MSRNPLNRLNRLNGLDRRTRLLAGAALAVVLILVISLGIALSSGPSGKPSATATSPAHGASSPAARSTGTPAQPDIACGKPATASSTADSQNPASDTTDCSAGSSAAPWISGAVSSGSDEWLQVDLGASSPVDHVVVVWGTDYAQKFKVRVSADGSSWRTVQKVSDGTGGTQTVTLPAGTATQWIQLYLEQPAQSASQYAVARFEVYAMSDAGAPQATPSANTSTNAALGTGAVTGTASGQWSSGFSGFGTTAWKTQWGYTSTGQFNQQDLSAISDPSAPGGTALQVYYGAGSSANTCKDCPSRGGGQFYQKLSDLGATGAALADSATLDLKYSIKLPAGWDFGEAGKLPGLYGGIVGQESGGTHGANGWSTRYMFRNHANAANAGEIYLYTPTNSGPTGYGVDYFGNWDWTADGQWHTVEQLVNRQTGSVTVWFDGAQVLSAPGIATGISNIPFGGVFFSTFFGGHDTTWGPKKAEYAYFAGFSLSTAVQH